MSQLNPDDFIISRKRKKYKFALFANSPLCFEADEWEKSPVDVLELGAGTGLFGVALAAAEPDKQFLAVDVKADRLQTGARKSTADGLENIRFLRARAEDQLPELVAPHSLERIWVTFPDPFPRARSAKHRLTHPSFLAFYQRALQPAGALYFKTDARGLFDWSLEQLVAEGWRIDELSFDLHESGLDDGYKIPTTYEARFMNDGIKINFVKAAPPQGE